MRIFVYKPERGKTALRLDDRHGLTGMHEVREGVAVEDVAQVVGALTAPWEERREKIRRARLGESPVA